MRIDECFTLFQQAAVKQNVATLSFSIKPSDEKDFLVCDIAKVIAKRDHKNTRVIADIISSNLPFVHQVLPDGTIKFNLWQEVIS